MHDHKLITYEKHNKGDEIYIVYVINAEANGFIGKLLTQVLFYQVSDLEE